MVGKMAGQRGEAVVIGFYRLWSRSLPCRQVYMFMIVDDIAIAVVKRKRELRLRKCCTCNPDRSAE